MKLYAYFRSSAAFRVNIALHYKKLNYEYEAISLLEGKQLQEDYRSLNPQGLVPALETEQGILAQSLAIIEYLEELHPKPALLPETPWEKAQVRSLTYAIACDTHPLNNLRVLKYLSEELNVDEQQKNSWYAHWIQQTFAGLETLFNSDDRLYCFGDTISMADVCLVPQVYNAKRFNVDLSAFPKLLDINKRLNESPAFIEALPEKQIDAPS